MNLTPDMFGGIWLITGAIVICLSIRRAHIDREVKGVSPSIAIFFALLNVYYCWFYFYLGQWWSFWGALSLCITQLFWWGQMMHCNWRNRKNAVERKSVHPDSHGPGSDF